MDKKRFNKILVTLISSLFLLLSVPVIHFSSTGHDNEFELLSGVPLHVNEFGLISDSLISSHRRFGSGESVDMLLMNLGIEKKMRNRILTESSSFIKGFSSGDIYHAYWNVINPEELQYIVLEKDPVNYIIVNLSDPVSVYEGQKEFSIKRKIIEGEIKTSFYHSLRKNDLHPELISRLSDIYQWQINFHRLKRGDTFKFIIEEKYAGDSLVTDPKIAGAYFKHNGTEFYAIRFNDGKSHEYYDLNGKNVRKTFLQAPLAYSSITSPYSDSRFHPILKIKKPHFGTDYAAPAGTPVHTVADGIIAEARFTKGNGNFIRVVHDQTYATQYLHLSRFAKGILPGTRVKSGDVIGYVGSTGLATGPHLCFRFWKNGVQVDPQEEKFPSNTILKGNNLETFLARRDTILNVLEVKRLDLASK